MKTGTVLAILLLSLIALAHLVRFVLGIEVEAGGVRIPMWISLIAIVVPAGIAYQVWREHKG